jgi:alpha-glutamyl/putrescinyl thymine pyrophosphorylase clade 1
MTKSLAIHVHRTPPQPRLGVYELYWIFASRRQAAFEARSAGKRWPWTDDPILRTYKFCNVFRAADRVSQFMIRDVAYGHDSESTATDRIFQIVAFRTFSKIQTWRGVRDELGGAPRIEHLRNGSFERALDRVKIASGGLYTGAFILCANKAFGFDEKHRNHVGLFKHMFLEHACAERLLQAQSLETVVRLLESFPLLGPFMAYQTAIDLNYSELINFSENDYTQPGPGALRGLKKAFTTLGDYSPAETIMWMVERQEEEFARLDLPFSGLFGRKLHGIDCQGLFCELDKYCREAVPDLASARSRIKAKYIAAHGDIDLFFPPKWGLPSGGVVKTIGVQSAQPAATRKRSGRRPGREHLAVADLFG